MRIALILCVLAAGCGNPDAKTVKRPVMPANASLTNEEMSMLVKTSKCIHIADSTIRLNARNAFTKDWITQANRISEIADTFPEVITEEFREIKGKIRSLSFAVQDVYSVFAFSPSGDKEELQSKINDKCSSIRDLLVDITRMCIAKYPEFDFKKMAI